MSNKVGATLVVGGGIAGIQAALDLADAGFKVYVLDESPSIGGTMAQLDKTFPTNDCSMCILAPKLVGVGRHPNIQLITNARLEELSGQAGNFQVKVTRKPRYVNEETCNGCGICAQHCPVEVPNEFDEKLNIRKAIYVPFPQAVPLKYAIDEENCIKCELCRNVCRAGAVDFDQKPEVLTLNVGAVILAPGFEEFDPRLKSMYGYGRYANVVSSIEFERILSASGPYGGRVVRPSDGKIPWRIAFVQCVGSRDALVGNNYCSSACCMYAIKESVIAREHSPGVSCTIFFMDMRAFGKEFDSYYNRAVDEYKVRFVRSRVSSVHEIPETQNLIVRHVDDETPKDEEFDLVVLSVGMRPPKRAQELAKIADIELNKYNFCETKPFSPVETSQPGIYVCGAFAAPKDIPESVAQASGAAAKAGSIIATERGKFATGKVYPPERDVSGEEPRIGVFVCHCGINIGGVVNVPAVVDYARTLPNVMYAEHNLYTCSQDTQKGIREKIKEHELNRVIVASCTPRTHEPLFRETVREAGLNIYLFEMANIRDQCSWVHMHEPKEATVKAKDLVRAAVAKARLLKPLKKPVINVAQSALVIGGGLSGMVASLELANQGFDVHLVERKRALGGHAREIYYLLDPQDPQKQLESIIREVESDNKIHVHLNSDIEDIEGYIGNFKTTIDNGGEKKEIEHGVVIVATGAAEYKPNEYLYGTDQRVLTQHELEKKLAKGDLNARTVAMIQCVGSRNPERPNCSRICCGQAVKNALKVKELSPDTDVYVLYKDMRTFGFMEDYYREASDKGVIFIRYDDEHKPNVTKKEGKLTVAAWEPVLKEWVPIEPDLLILSVATVPQPDNKHLAEMLKVPLSKDGFFLEAHMKLRPVDFATDGVFLCGMAHSPKFIDESIAQACAAAARAATVLSKSTLEMEGSIANVDENLCSGCKICESLCVYNAIEMRMNSEKPVAKVIEALCKGCGVCGSSCPTKAITLGHFTNEQILAQVKAVLVEESKHD
ncbi:MAG TPA: CoB--CoM heterodisulfide reductase iron-sulfur subunit A family protein [Candidatus Bathyarchaeia archaeon]|nr:CoB--CoM heterodisulfide reductase iron-sulfur subunit A family protein [Candidatus Bathyarchaeia archaeon]